MTSIVKITRLPHETHWLVFDERHRCVSHLAHDDLMPAIRRAIGADIQAYFRAELVRRQWVLVERVAQEKW